MAPSNPSVPLDWDRLQRGSLIAAVVGMAGCAIGAGMNLGQFFRSYLVAYNFWLGIALGCLVILMLQYLTGGAWGALLRHLLESATRTLLLLAILFVPLVLGGTELYSWARPEAVAEDPDLQHKAVYLNMPFFVGRAVTYFLIWVGVSFFLNRWSVQEDQAPTYRPRRRFQILSAGGLILYGLTITFASIDWVMSIEPRWYSTIYPVMFATSQVLTAFAFAVAVLLLLAAQPPITEMLTPARMRDLGNLLLTFVMLWAYMSISQFLLIWTGNLPEEIPWYLRRMRGGWEWVGIIVILLHFALPFLLLLARDIKENQRTLAAVAVGLLGMRFLDMLWWIEPAYSHQGQYGFWLVDVAALVGMGGIWMWWFLWHLKHRPLLSVHHAALLEAPHD